MVAVKTAMTDRQTDRQTHTHRLADGSTIVAVKTAMASLAAAQVWRHASFVCYTSSMMVVTTN